MSELVVHVIYVIFIVFNGEKKINKQHNPFPSTDLWKKSLFTQSVQRNVLLLRITAPALHQEVLTYSFLGNINLFGLLSVHRFSPAPTLKVAIELLPYHRMSWAEDPNVPEGRRLHVTGSMDETVKYLAQAMNFT